MMGLPEIPLLGKLELVETYVFFDFPRLFLCKNSTGQRFIALSVEETDTEHRWIYVPASRDRVAALRAGDIALRSAIDTPEDKYVYVIREENEGTTSSAELMAGNRIPHHWLPDPQQRLHVESELEDLEYPSEQASANATRRETLNVVLDTGRRNEAPLRWSGELLVAIQELVDALGQYKNGETTDRGAIPQSVLTMTQLNVAKAFAGSFGVQVRAENPSDLFGESLIHQTLTEFIELLETADNEERIGQKLSAIKGRGAAKYRSLLEVIIHTESKSVQWRWGSPSSPTSRIVELSQDQYRKALSIVTAITTEMDAPIVIKARIVGVNVRTKTYELQQTNSLQKYSGRIDDSALPSLENSRISGLYNATLAPLREVNSSTGEEKTKWLLKSIEEVQE